MSNIIVGCCNLIEQDGRILLVQETKEKVKGKYSWPAGRLEPDESLVECAKREAREEARIEVELKALIGIYQRFSDDQNIVDFVFASTITSGKPMASEEHPVARFFSADEISSLEGSNQLRHGATFKRVLEDYRQGIRLSLENIQFIDKPTTHRIS